MLPINDPIACKPITSWLARIYKGGVTPREIIDARARGELTASQTRTMLSEVRRVDHENRTLAAQAGKAEESVFKTHAYRSAEDFLEGMLKPRPQRAADIDGSDVAFDRVQLAQAKLELAQRSRGKKPEEVRDIATEIQDRYMKRRSNFSEARRGRVGRGEIPFSDLREVREAASRGILSNEEIRTYIDHFKANQPGAK